ncbi:MAG: hypothetical protein KY461_02055 [Actinobacteria bacterium]|nr:hypothetical protein [Actinomycetota bacterium]
MKKLLTASITSAVLALGAAAPALAHSAPPCDDADGDGSSSGEEYAQHHIRPNAEEGSLGSSQDQAADEGTGHSPGAQHQGYSACDPSGQ